MASYNSLKGVVCLNHTDKPAVARCAVCRKPLCGNCMKQSNDMIFCSDKCMKNGLESVGRVNKIVANKKRTDFAGTIRKLITLIVLALIVLGCYHYRKPIKKQWNKWFNKSVNYVENFEEEGTKAFKNKKNRVQRKQHGEKYDAVDGTLQ